MDFIPLTRASDSTVDYLNVSHITSFRDVPGGGTRIKMVDESERFVAVLESIDEVLRLIAAKPDEPPPPSPDLALFGVVAALAGAVVGGAIGGWVRGGGSARP